jgi:PAS domain S-box
MVPRNITIKAKANLSPLRKTPYKLRLRLLGSIIILLLLILGLFLGLLTARRLRSIISEDFNQQQLILARHIARMVDQNIQFLKGELLSLSLSPSIATFRKGGEKLIEDRMDDRMDIALKTVRNSNVVAITVLDSSGQALKIVGEKEAYLINPPFDFKNLPFFQWCLLPEHRNHVFIRQFEPRKNPDDNHLYMIMATPVYQYSDRSHRNLPSSKPIGLVAFLIDSTRFLEKFTKEIRSGKTGYAWVIDNNGNFVIHIEKNFIGENAFLARKARDPNINFVIINTIQKEAMLKGKEGTGWYYSGWHRGIIGKVRKLVAFTPIHLSEEDPTYLWSVAVAAPNSEVENVVHTVYLPQFIGSGVLVMVIILVGFYIINFGRTLNRTLEEKVRIKTEELRQSNEELAQSEKRYRALVEKSRDLIFTVDYFGRFTSLNYYGTELFGKPKEEYIGQGLDKAFSPEGAAKLLKIAHEVIDTGKDIQLEHDIIIGGKLFWFLSHLIPFTQEEEKTSLVLVFSRDVTSQHQIREEEIVRTEKLAAIGTLAAGVAHEINNPICIILGFAEYLLNKTAPLSKEFEILETIKRQASNCQKIVENLLSFARVPAKATNLMNVNDDLKKVIDVTQNTLLTKKIDLVLNLATDLPHVMADSSQIQQVFLNFITNGVDAMQNGGRFTIATRLNQKKDHVEIEFRDTGIGITKKNLTKIFDPFFTTKEVGEGTGLGLAVSYGIIKKFGGEIQVESVSAEENPNSTIGTVFTVKLPIYNFINEEIP